jgi:capsular exopolysaccharide synthesis family protein
MTWPFRIRRRDDEAPAGELDEFVVLIDDRLDARLVVYHTPESLHAEQYRAFRTNLRAMNPGDEPRALLFTSAEPGVGKSVSLANIALSLAEFQSINVCLVDADIRVGSQSTLFGASREPGLSDLMLDKLAPGDVLRATAMPNLSVITAGRRTEGASDVLTSGYMADLLGWLKRRFHYVLVDSPPTLLFADSAELATLCDGVILVVALDETRRTDADLALVQLQSAGANVVGSFVTGATAESEDPYADAPDDPSEA